MEITKEQVEKFNEELNEFGCRAEFWTEPFSVHILKGYKLIGMIFDFMIAFYHDGDCSLTNKCKILKLAAKYFGK